MPCTVSRRTHNDLVTAPSPGLNYCGAAIDRIAPAVIECVAFAVPERPQVWRQFRLVFGLQVLATLLAALLAGWFAGLHGALSAAIGGGISIVAGLGFAIMVAGRKARTAGEVLRVAMRAESLKIILVVVLLWQALTRYPQVVVAVLIGTFCLTILIFSMALFFRESRES